MTLKLLTTFSNIHKSIDEQWFFFARGELCALANTLSVGGGCSNSRRALCSRSTLSVGGDCSNIDTVALNDANSDRE
jgi:hypothetical protein